MKVKKVLACIGLALVWAIALAATFTDDFNRADSGTNTGWGANWLHHQSDTLSLTGAEIVGNQGSITASFTDRSATWNGGAVGADQFSEATVVSFSSDGQAMVSVRQTDADNLYGAGVLNSGAIVIRKRVAGVNTSLVTDLVAVSPGDVLRLEIVGDELNFFINSALALGPITDSDISTGQPGLYVTNTTVWDDWSGGDIGGGGGGSNVPAIYRHLRQMKQ